MPPTIDFGEEEFSDAPEQENIAVRDGRIELDEITPNIIDNFEDSPDGPYGEDDDLSTFYNEDLNEYDRVSTPTIEGEFALQTSTQNGYIRSDPDDGLPFYPAAGDDFAFAIHTDGEPFPSFAFLEPEGATANTGREGEGAIVFIIDPSGDDARIRRIEDGSSNDLDTVTFTGSAGDFYDTQVETDYDSDLDDLSITVTVHELDQSSGDRTEQVVELSTTITPDRTEGAISWFMSSSSGTVTFDNARPTE